MKILITAGGTHEHIDPVRYITNASSGLQGILLAQEAIKRGCKVELILAPTHIPVEYHPDLNVTSVVSAEDMFRAAQWFHPMCDVSIFSAAVGDYHVKDRSDQKIKRDGNLMLELVPNPDIAKYLGSCKRANQTHIGFALETNNGVQNALAKIQKKNLDYVVLNETSKDNPAFTATDNKVIIINRQGFQIDVPKTSKEEIANKILNLVVSK